MCSSIAALSNCLLEYRLFFLCAGVSALSLQKSKKDKKGTKFASFGMISNLMKKVSANARTRACTHTHTHHTHTVLVCRVSIFARALHTFSVSMILTLSLCLRLSRAAACFSFLLVFFVVSTVSMSLCLCASAHLGIKGAAQTKNRRNGSLRRLSHQGCRPLHHATDQGHAAVTKQLLEACSNVDLQEKDESTGNSVLVARVGYVLSGGRG